MKIWTAPYELHPRTTLGGHARAGAREGALIRIETADDALGHADLHPWPELGDPALERQLAVLRDGGRTPQLVRSLRFAHLEAEASRGGRSLFDGLAVPPSHRLLTDPATAGATDLEGFDRAKVKVSPDRPGIAEAIARLDGETGGRIRWRLDANATFDAAGILAFLAELRERVGTARADLVDFVEDPCPYDAEDWRRIGSVCPLALDRETGGQDDPAVRSVLVVKPAIQDPRDFAGERRVAITSYLDHPVGQIHSAASAARFAREYPEAVDVGGLLSHTAYEPTPYSEALASRGPVLVPPAGPGIGFGELLARESWRRLV